MLNKEDKRKLIHNALGYVLESELIEEMSEVARFRETITDEVVVNVGDNLKLIPILISGSIKISREDNDGNELLLYYIESGDTCAMTLQCCSSKSNSEIKATSMEPSVMFMFPAQMMEYWMDKYKSWREYIISSYHMRLTEIMETVDAIAFLKLDERLLKYLNDQAKLLGTLEIHHTHQQIADDLHSSRVVISRLLKQFENKGIIELYRNNIVIKQF